MGMNLMWWIILKEKHMDMNMGMNLIWWSVLLVALAVPPIAVTAGVYIWRKTKRNRRYVPASLPSDASHDSSYDDDETIPF